MAGTIEAHVDNSQAERAETPLTLIDFLEKNKGQRIQTIVFVDNAPGNQFHLCLVPETGNDEGFRESDFENALVWFEKRMQQLTPTEEQVRIIEPGTEWQLRQTQRLRQNWKTSAFNILHREVSAADILQMTEIAVTLGGIKTQLCQRIGNSR
jgi:hypothetical protein